MRSFSLLGLLLVGAVFLSGCATIKGSTYAEQRQFILSMRDRTLKKLYKKTPIAREHVRKSAGYGVFSSVNTNLFLLSTARGYGVVTDNKTKKVIYMKMASIGGGLGIGIKDFRAIIIFRKRASMKKFIEKGWEFGAQADAAFKSGEKGDAYSAAASTDLDVITYQITEAGAAIQATLQGTKYWKHKDLN